MGEDRAGSSLLKQQDRAGSPNFQFGVIVLNPRPYGRGKRHQRCFPPARAARRSRTRSKRSHAEGFTLRYLPPAFLDKLFNC
ncbi:hypothetical protein A6V25_23660 [Nostoc sp. ATCC 53789]|nr:hypothetical protein A6V25_23660 [Nostoc sp. ATCC 53789]